MAIVQDPRNEKLLSNFLEIDQHFPASCSHEGILRKSTSRKSDLAKVVEDAVDLMIDLSRPLGTLEPADALQRQQNYANVIIGVRPVNWRDKISVAGHLQVSNEACVKNVWPSLARAQLKSTSPFLSEEQIQEDCLVMDDLMREVTSGILKQQLREPSNLFTRFDDLCVNLQERSEHGVTVSGFKW
eukprot:Filipodium_phascolosomae@DN2444_c0_g1_i8.p1